MALEARRHIATFFAIERDVMRHPMQRSESGAGRPRALRPIIPSRIYASFIRSVSISAAP